MAQRHPMTRADGLGLVRAWTKNENLIRHMLAVEAAMRAYARHFGEDEELWALAGLLHDADYELHPERHPAVIISELEKLGVDSGVIQAISAHARHLATPADSLLDKAILACDELTGFITALALMRPTRLEGLSPGSVMKKLKDPRFAAAIDRKAIRLNTATLGIELPEHIERVVAAMQGISSELGLEA